MKENIGENIRKVRVGKNISQQDLAKALNVDRSTVSGWETGKRSPDTNMIVRLSAVLDVPVQSLMAQTVQSGEKLRVIIVDDEKIILKHNASVIRQALPSAEIIAFSKPSDAIEYADRYSVDLAFLDIELGKISGLDLCQRLLEINSSTNVLFLTAYREYSFDAWSTGARGFLLKPLTAEEVRARLEILNQGRK